MESWNSSLDLLQAVFPGMDSSKEFHPYPLALSLTNDSCNYPDGEDPCASLVPKHDLITAKFILLSVVGFCIALFGLCGNLSILAVMIRPSMRHSSNNMYLAT